MYNLDFTRKAFKNLKKIDAKYQNLIIEKLELLAENPAASPNVKALKGESGYYRLRVANYRVIFEVNNNELLILILITEKTLINYGLNINKKKRHHGFYGDLKRS